MDPSALPCDDFYQFACGSWLKENVIPEDKSKYGIIHQVDDEVSIKLKCKQFHCHAVPSLG